MYDKDRNKKGYTMVRGEKIQPGDYLLVVHVCIFNAKGEMLIQQRQPFKDSWQNMWDLTVGGSATSGDTSQMAAQRELQEELGIHIDFREARPYFTNHFEYGFDDIYFLEQDLDLSTLQLQYEEVQAVKWASKEQIIKMIRSGEFIPYYESLITYIFDLYLSKKRHGIRQFKEFR